MRNRHWILTAVMLLSMILAPRSFTWADSALRIDARVQVNTGARDLRVWIWPDRGEGADYFPGEPIRVNVEVSRDAYLILYDIDTRGNLRILFPYDPWEDNFISAGEVVRFPRSWDGNSWTVDGPSGVEYIQAIVSEFPIAPPDWPVYLRSVNHGGAVAIDAELRDFRAGADPLAYIRVVNRKITGRYWDWAATDLATFYVRPPYYRRVFTRYDPWPEVFYGEIYIGWPIGGRIYVDGVYVGVAPLRVPRRRYGRHVITLYDHLRIVRRQSVICYAKRDFRYRASPYRAWDVHRYGYVKRARRGGAAFFSSRAVRHDRQQVRRSGRSADRRVHRSNRERSVGTRRRLRRGAVSSPVVDVRRRLPMRAEVTRGNEHRRVSGNHGDRFAKRSRPAGGKRTMNAPRNREKRAERQAVKKTRAKRHWAVAGSPHRLGVGVSDTPAKAVRRAKTVARNRSADIKHDTKTRQHVTLKSKRARRRS